MQSKRGIRQLVGLGLLLTALLAISSPAFAHGTPAEAANKKLVVDFYKALNAANADGAMKERIEGIAEKYLGADYVQHSESFAHLPGPGSARDRLVRMFQSMPAMQGMPEPKTLAVMAEGDMVMMLTSREMPAPAGAPAKPAYIFNMFRVAKGHLVEHWDVSSMPLGPGGPPMPPAGVMPPAAELPAQGR